MNNRNYDCIIIISVISGLFITTCDYLVQMKTVETDYFVSRLLSLEETILKSIIVYFLKGIVIFIVVPISPNSLSTTATEPPRD